jgi:hypothetical protein
LRVCGLEGDDCCHAEENHPAFWEDGTVLALVDMLTRPTTSPALKNDVRRACGQE